jgi:hypothetical protein
LSSLFSASRQQADLPTQLLFKDHFVAKKLCWLIVDDQDIHRIAIALHGGPPALAM